MREVNDDQWWVNYPFKSQKSHFRSHSIIKAMLVGNLTQKYTAAMSILAKPVNWRDRDRKAYSMSWIYVIFMTF